jgi:glycosyltransferase involved in cell wall biosynthesis
MKIFYWSPFTSHVATIKAVINSAHGLKKCFNYETTIINTFGEWKKFTKDIKSKKIKIIYNKQNKNINSTNGYFNSRIAFIRIFFHSFLFLKTILLKKKPNYLIIHLITSLPLILFLIFKFDTRLILRISGLPKLNIIRKFLWKFSNNKIQFVTVPTKETYIKIKKMKIFDSSKIYYLPDPVFIASKIKAKKNYKEKKGNKYILNIGRLTKQKNHKLLIQSFKEISLKYSNLKLIILGDGEKYTDIKKQIKLLKLKDKVKLIGHSNKVYEYIQGSLCVIVSSLWEDPGFVMIEASALKKIVINSNCPSGPKEFFNNGKTGFLFHNNNTESLIKTFDKFMQTKKSKINFLIKKSYKKSLNYSEISHAKNLKKLFEIYEKR